MSRLTSRVKLHILYSVLEMKEIKMAAKALTIPVLEALCDTYTKNLEQFMQANEIPQDSEVVSKSSKHPRSLLLSLI